MKCRKPTQSLERFRENGPVKLVAFQVRCILMFKFNYKSVQNMQCLVTQILLNNMLKFHSDMAKQKSLEYKSYLKLLPMQFWIPLRCLEMVSLLKYKYTHYDTRLKVQTFYVKEQCTFFNQQCSFKFQSFFSDMYVLAFVA